VFVQWIGLSYLDTGLLKSLITTLTAVYANVRVYNPSLTELFFFASEAPLNIEEALGRALNTPDLERHLAEVGIHNHEDLLAALALDEAAAARFGAGAPPSSDDFNLMATRSRYLEDGLAPTTFYRVIADLDPIGSREFWQRLRATDPRIDHLYLASKLAVPPATRSRLQAMARVLDDPQQAQMTEAVSLVSSRQTGLAREKLRQVLAADPANQEARWLLVSTQIDALLTGTASRELREQADALTGVPAAVLAGLRHEQAGEWSRIAELDGTLADARTTDHWFAATIRLRAGWRLQPDRGDRRALAAEALALIDTVMPLRSNLPVVVQRAQAAEIAGNAPVTLESSALVLDTLGETLKRFSTSRRPLPGPERASMGTALRAITDLLGNHPEWREHPRGDTVYAAADRLEVEFFGRK
jgi:hypothetical protein